VNTSGCQRFAAGIQRSVIVEQMVRGVCVNGDLNKDAAVADKVSTMCGTHFFRPKLV